VSRADRVEKWLEIPILLAAISVIPTILIQESSLGEPWQPIANVMNWTSWSIVMIVGVGLVAILTGAIAERFIHGRTAPS
jgi:hypothetical protein